MHETIRIKNMHISLIQLVWILFRPLKCNYNKHLGSFYPDCRSVTWRVTYKRQGITIGTLWNVRSICLITSFIHISQQSQVITQLITFIIGIGCDCQQPGSRSHQGLFTGAQPLNILTGGVAPVVLNLGTC